MPKEDWTYVGTTDTDYQGDPGQARTDAADVAYILEAVNTAFPGRAVVPGDVVSTWAGVRPLVAEEGAPTPRMSRATTRSQNEPPGLVSIAGGKLTTYRSMAQDLLDRLVAAEGRRLDWSPPALPHGETASARRRPPRLRTVRRRRRRRPGGGLGPLPAAASHLVRTYGTEHPKVLAYACRDKRAAGAPHVRRRRPARRGPLRSGGGDGRHPGGLPRPPHRPHALRPARRARRRPTRRPPDGRARWAGAGAPAASSFAATARPSPP